MILSVQRQNIFDCIILLLIYLQLVILGFLGYEAQLNKIILAAVLFRFSVIKWKNVIDKRQFTWLVVSIGLFTLSCLFASGGNELKSNSLMLLYGFTVLIYVTYLCRKKSEFINNVVRSSFWIFNLTAIINVIVLVIQINIPFLIIGKITTEEISYYEDTICGLFSYGGTHLVCMFSVFIVLYNFALMQTLRNKMKKNVLFVYNIALLISFTYTSLNSDNKMFFLLTPLSLVVFFFWGRTQLSAKRIFNTLGLVLIFLFTLLFTYNLIEPFKNIVDDNIISLVSSSKNDLFEGNKANGSSERLAMIPYALSTERSWLFGDGLTHSFYKQDFHGFNHFGQADFASFLILGGIWFSVSYLILYMSFLSCIAYPSPKKRNKATSLLLSLLVCVIYVYTQLFSRIIAVEALILIFLSYRIKLLSYENKISTSCIVNNT